MATRSISANFPLIRSISTSFLHYDSLGLYSLRLQWRRRRSSTDELHRRLLFQWCRRLRPKLRPLTEELQKLIEVMGREKKAGTIFIRLVSSGGTGFFYVKMKNPKKMTEKLEFRKYDPRVNRHVLFTGAKMK